MFTGHSFSGLIVLLLSLSHAHCPMSPPQVSHTDLKLRPKHCSKPFALDFPLFWISSANLVAAKYFIFAQHPPPSPSTWPRRDQRLSLGVLIPAWSLETRDIKHEDCKIICIQFLPLLPFLWLHRPSLIPSCPISPRVSVTSHPQRILHQFTAFS